MDERRSQGRLRNSSRLSSRRAARPRRAAGVQFAAFGLALSRSVSRRLEARPLTLRRSEDAYVDELFAPCVALGAPLLRARFPRAFLDLNREPYELDPQMFDGPLPDFANTRSLRVAAGLGRFRASSATRSRSIAGAMPVADALARDRRAASSLSPRLARIAGARAARDSALAILVDCHSMPSTLARGRRLRHRARRPLRLERRALDRRGARRRCCARGYPSAATSPMPAATSPSITARPPRPPRRADRDQPRPLYGRAHDRESGSRGALAEALIAAAEAWRRARSREPGGRAAGRRNRRGRWRAPA